MVEVEVYPRCLISNHNCRTLTGAKLQMGPTPRTISLAWPLPGRLPSSNRQHLMRKVPHLTERRSARHALFALRRHEPHNQGHSGGGAGRSVLALSGGPLASSTGGGPRAHGGRMVGPQGREAPLGADIVECNALGPLSRAQRKPCLQRGSAPRPPVKRSLLHLSPF